MSALALSRGKMLGGKQSPAEKDLLVFTVQDNNFHDQILVLAEQGDHFRTARTLGRGKLLPGLAMAAELVERGLETFKQGFSRAGLGFGIEGVGTAQVLIVLFHDRQDLAA